MKAAQEFNLSDALWVRIAPLLPVHTPKPHPLGCHRQRVADRQVLDGIFFVLRTGCQWKALDVTGICSGSTAHRRFQDWVQAGIWARLWDEALAEYDEIIGLDLEWCSLDGSLHKAPLGGGEPGPTPRTGARAGSSAASWSRRRACPSASNWTGPIGTT